MQVVGVVDLCAGRAVRACGGNRDAYHPVMEVAGSAIAAGDPKSVARVYVEDLGVSAIYVADLDAILGRASQHEQVSLLAAAGAPIWVDAGIHDATAARQAIAHGASRVVVGLETLRSFRELEAVCEAVDPAAVMFSLDLRGRTPMMSRDADETAEPPQIIAKRAVDAGARAIIVLNLERVGTRQGMDFTMLERLRSAVPDTVLFAGGGVRGLDDLTALVRCGYDGALVATALQDGVLSAADLARVQSWPQERAVR